MLKIKDDVDLKELEKFGFKKNEDNEYECIGQYPLEDDVTLSINVYRPIGHSTG